MNSNKIPIVYIVGSGHCGSTLLDILLGTHPDVFGTGELTALHRFQKGNEVVCSCKKHLEDCEVWGDFVRQNAILPDIAVSQSKMGILYGSNNFVDRNKKPIDADEYIRQQESIYDYLIEKTGARAIVDSSKMPERAVLMQGSTKYEPIILHIVRDPRAVTWSYYRKYKRVFPYIFKWLLSNLKVELLSQREMKKVCVLYEDLVKDPEAILNSIYYKIGLKRHNLPVGNKLQHSHLIGGNRMRLGEVVDITCDKSWEHAMSTLLRKATYISSLVLWVKYKVSK
jgi:hypothetical protein